MKRQQLSRQVSRKIYRKNTGVHRMNSLNPRQFRGGIRL